MAEVENLFTKVKTSTNNVLLNFKEINNMVSELDSSKKIVSEFGLISNITEEPASSIEEVLSSVEFQNERIQYIINEFNKMYQKNNKLI